MINLKLKNKSEKLNQRSKISLRQKLAGQKKQKSRVLIGLSGGVDSSVAAALLKKQGYQVIGVFLKFSSPFAKATGDKSCGRENRCCNYEALTAARSVADKLKIPFYVFDASKQFKKDVVDYFVKEYDAGRTPNPCVVCNKKIKFGWMLEKAKKLGCDFVATGHYARIKIKNQKSKVKIAKQNVKSYDLFQAKDGKKDQTYFLWQLDQKQLAHILFPLGNYEKKQVRNIAKKLNLTTAQKKESQDLCFINNKSEFLSAWTKKLNKSGDIIDTDGNLVGKHNGLCYYTVGQRKGLDVQLKNVDSGFKPVYVVRLDIEKNNLIVGLQEDLYCKKLFANNANWINANYINKKNNILNCFAKIRFGQKKEKCKIKVLNNVLEVLFDKPIWGITPGQSIVFYNKNEIIGGAIII